MASKTLNIIMNGRDNASGKVNRVQASLKKLASVAKAASIATAAAAAGGFLAVRKEMERLDEAAKVSSRIGIAVDELMALQHAAGLSGVSAQVLEKGLQTLSRQVSDAADGTGEAVQAFEKLGLSAEELKRQSPDQQFAAITKALEGVENQAERVAIAYDLFGGRGASLLQITNQGAESLNRMTQEAKDLGLTISAVDAQAIQSANDSILRMKSAFRGIVTIAAVELAPVMDVIAQLMRGMNGDAQDTRDSIREMVDAGVEFIDTFVTPAMRAFQFLSGGISMTVGEFGQMVDPSGTMAQFRQEGINQMQEVLDKGLFGNLDLLVEKARRETQSAVAAASGSMISDLTGQEITIKRSDAGGGSFGGSSSSSAVDMTLGGGSGSLPSTVDVFGQLRDAVLSGLGGSSGGGGGGGRFLTGTAATTREAQSADREKRMLDRLTEIANMEKRLTKAAEDMRSALDKLSENTTPVLLGAGL